MTMNDSLAAVLSHIQNYSKDNKTLVVTKANAAFIRKILSILQDNRYIGSFEEVQDGKGDLLKINLIGAINQIGVIKPRFAVTKDRYESFEKRFLPAKDFGIIIVSTSKGLMTHIQAKGQGIGGRLICYCY